LKFQEAFDKVFDKERERFAKSGKGEFVVVPATAKILTFLWNMIAIANNELDDTVYLDAGLNIISQPLKEKKDKKKDTSTSSKENKTDIKDSEEENGKKEEEKVPETK
jgi:hypothetical protein